MKASRFCGAARWADRYLHAGFQILGFRGVGVFATHRIIRKSARQAVKEMHRQVGDLKIEEDGTARRGSLLRHLLMLCRHGRNAGDHAFCGAGNIPGHLRREHQRPNSGLTGRSCEIRELMQPIRKPDYVKALEAAREEGILRIDRRPGGYSWGSNFSGQFHSVSVNLPDIQKETGLSLCRRSIQPVGTCAHAWRSALFLTAKSGSRCWTSAQNREEWLRWTMAQLVKQHMANQRLGDEQESEIQADRFPP